MPEASGLHSSAPSQRLKQTYSAMYATMYAMERCKTILFLRHKGTGEQTPLEPQNGGNLPCWPGLLSLEYQRQHGPISSNQRQGGTCDGSCSHVQSLDSP